MPIALTLYLISEGRNAILSFFPKMSVCARARARYLKFAHASCFLPERSTFIYRLFNYAGNKSREIGENRAVAFTFASFSTTAALRSASPEADRNVIKRVSVGRWALNGASGHYY